MITATLRRTKMGDSGTFGVLEVLGHTFLTGELPWRDNAQEISSIPAGAYVCQWTPSNRFKRETYQVMDVPGRTGVRFHPANLMGDSSLGYKAELNGCVALGSAMGVVDGQEAITGSRAAIKQFEELLAGQSFRLEISDEYLEAGEPLPASVV